MIGNVLGARRGIGFIGQAAGGAAFAGAYDAIPSITAAYGMRRLLTSYTGAIIRIRRSSDSTEQDIGYDTDGHLDTAAVASFVGGGSGYVKTWYDQSGNGYDAVQTDTTKQPLYVASGQNGRSVARFDGVNDFLPNNTFSTAILSAGASSVAVAMTSNSTKTARLYHNSVAQTNVFSIQNFIDGPRAIGNAGSIVITSTFAVSNGAFWIANSQYDLSNLKLSINNHSVADQPMTGTLITTVGLEIGGRSNETEFWVGDISELIICNAALSNDDRSAAETAANNYWAVY